MNLLLTVPAAIGLGILHSLEPGHGKGVMTAYLISSRSKMRDAILLGVVSAIAHTISIVMLSFAASSTVSMLVPEEISHWIELLAGLFITVLGSRLFLQQVRPRVVVVRKIGEDHLAEVCEHRHEHRHRHGQKHNKQQSADSIARLFLVGVVTGLIPCPSAVAIFLASMSAHEIPVGLTLVLSFSLGSVLAMSTVAILVTRAGRSIQLLEKRNVVRIMGTLSSFLMVSLGGFVIFQSLRHLTFLSY
jgi:ABC-type nickel/cobalt efflux system permease component RcnA